MRHISQDRLKKLAHHIDGLVDKDERQAKEAERILVLRREAFCQLHRICSFFARSINEILKKTTLELTPDPVSLEFFRQEGPNLIQIHVRGRLLQFEIEAPAELVSTENFRIPYILEGAARAFNQDLLDRNAIEEQYVFACLERESVTWHFFDARTYHAGTVDSNYLADLLERVV
jgi:hypothetical protein